ncbi:MAG: 2OG-Fe dioxygenase family protein [Thiomonas sp.]|nr:2OG-Fe dioxygenase family protein [Thiomonas sp.]
MPAGSSALDRLLQQGFCVLGAAELAAMAQYDRASCTPAFALWNDLPPDNYLKDGGHYRFRRHGSFIQTLRPAAGQMDLLPVPHRAHWQPTAYNALHGGMSRWFAPLSDALLQAAFSQPLLRGLGRLFAQVRNAPQWFVEAHQFRIDTREGVGRPTPEGAHRDGVDFVAVVLIARHGIRGGETRVFELAGQRGVRFTLAEPCSVLLMDDTRVIHESTPVLPEGEANGGWRDTLVLTYRAGGFLDPQPVG